MKNFRNELNKIKTMILTLGAMVEERVHRVARAIETVDVEIADNVIKSDYEIDDMEVEIEEECLKVLALYQPVAVDLRFLIAVIKINNDLERIGDETVNISRRILTMSKDRNQCDFPFDYSTMVEKIEYMLRKSLDSLVNLDINLATRVCLLDKEVDTLRKEAYDRIKEAMQINSIPFDFMINLLLISRHLERMGDHTTNIAEEVIYLSEGDIVRHNKSHKLESL